MKIFRPTFRFRYYPDGNRILESIADAAHEAYQSEGKQSDAEFVKSLIKRGHESCLEHESISVRVTCDRGISHEIVRHRLASYTQESTRYCNYSKGKFGNQISCIDIQGGINRDKTVQKLPGVTQALIHSEWLAACEDAEKHYMRMLELGASPQIARSVLNHSTKTAIVMTMNLRNWRHFFKLRTADDSHPQMQEVARLMLAHFKDAVPVVFDDI